MGRFQCSSALRLSQDWQLDRSGSETEKREPPKKKLLLPNSKHTFGFPNLSSLCLYLLFSGLSANDIASHDKWIKDITEISGCKVDFPIIGDKDRKIATEYDMLDALDATNVDSKGMPFTGESGANFSYLQEQRFLPRKSDLTKHLSYSLSISTLSPTVRDVFVIDPKKVIRLKISYPGESSLKTLSRESKLFVLACQFQLLNLLLHFSSQLLPVVISTKSYVSLIHFRSETSIESPPLSTGRKVTRLSFTLQFKEKRLRNYSQVMRLSSLISDSLLIHLRLNRVGLFIRRALFWIF